MEQEHLKHARQLAQQLHEDGHCAVPVNVERIAQTFGLVIRYETLERNVSGILVSTGAIGKIGVNQSHHLHRQRFTIAHEIGHWLLHRDKRSLWVDEIFWRSPKSAEGTDIEEMEANAFANELLMPEPLVREHFTRAPITVDDDFALRKFASRYVVSNHAMLLRLAYLGLVDV